MNRPGGRAATPRSLQRAFLPDYLRALDLILERLKAGHANIQSIEVVSQTAIKLPQSERTLPMALPIRLTPETNTCALRIKITETRRKTARAQKTSDSAGGKNAKRIHLLVSTPRTSSVASVWDLAKLISGS